MGTTSGESVSDGTADVKADGTGGVDEPKGEPKVYTQGDIDRLSKALDKERKRGDAAEKTLKDAELAKLPELEQAKAMAAELKAENEKLKRENLQSRVGADLKLPTRLWKKIDGETEEQMRRDAADMLNDLKPDSVAEGTPTAKNDGRKAPTNDGKAKGSAGTKTDMNTLLRAALKG